MTNPTPTNPAARSVRAMTAAVLAGVSLGGCGSNSSTVVRTPTVAPLSSSAVPSTTSPAPARHPTAVVTPAKGLRDRQIVRVTATGFSAGEALQVIECADKGTTTGPGDCNLTGMQSATSDAAGRISTQLQVVRGPFGANKIVCSKQQRCLVSVTQASLVADRGGRRPGRVRCRLRAAEGGLRNDAAVPHVHDPVGGVGDSGVVGDHDHGQFGRCAAQPLNQRRSRGRPRPCRGSRSARRPAAAAARWPARGRSRLAAALRRRAGSADATRSRPGRRRPATGRPARAARRDGVACRTSRSRRSSPR